MEYVYVGRIITTHGLKGEVKIRSNFKYKEIAFKVGSYIYIGKTKEKHEILSYRKHQDYDMLILSSIDDISIAINYKQELVYLNKVDLILPDNEYLDEDLIGLDAYYNKQKIGKVKTITDQGHNNFVILLDTGKYIPKNNNFILKVDLTKQEIHFKNMEGLLWK